ncbi:MAG: Toxin-antitoxin system protein [Parcubacteria group bacterium GW2011_GWA1_49_11]|nr:MAG: Toxin-antitoxin system protein [Parcubacteria group bacterium GW2011_GWA1_49_11]
MNTAVVTTKIDPQTKRLAMKTADELGIPLSVVIKAFLKQFIRTKAVSFSAEEEIPNDYLRDLMRQADKDLRTGKASPTFGNSKDAVAYLKKLGI